jgi:uncharacterized cupin superfamily protein
LTVQVIQRAADLTDLEDWGTVGDPITQPPCRLSGRSVDIPGMEGMRTGIWECSPGQYRRDVKDAEVMHILAGVATFTPDGGEPIQIEPGVTVFCPALTTGVWDIRSAVRKLYVCMGQG